MKLVDLTRIKRKRYEKIARSGEPRTGEYFDLLMLRPSASDPMRTTHVLWSGTGWLTILRLADMAALVHALYVWPPDDSTPDFRVTRFQRGAIGHGGGEPVATIGYAIDYASRRMRRRVTLDATGYTTVSEHRIK